MKTVSVLLVGIGGYGQTYVDLALDHAAGRGTRLAGIVDPFADRSPRLDAIRAAGVPVFDDLDAFYAAGHADLAVISTPIQLHLPQSLAALAKGSNVLCEKPLCGSYADARRLADAAATAKSFLAVGYQWSFSAAIQALKRDILAGDFGRPLRLKTLVLWPRAKSYYARNSWAGRQRTPDGRDVFDSPINNATAHYLHNMFYVLGATREASVWPREVEAELYRANPIENFDTAALRGRTEAGVEFLFYSAHAVAATIGPVMRYDFERATVTFESRRQASITARLADGTVRAYGDPNDGATKLWDCVDAVRGGSRVACPVEAALPHALCVQGAQASMPEIAVFPPEVVVTQGRAEDPVVCADGLDGIFTQCYDQGILPAEHGGVAWARKSRRVELAR